ASFAEAELAGMPVSDPDLRAEIDPCFVGDGAGRTDVVVLACTHYPLLLARLRDLAPWPVTWIDPAPAIAKRVVQLLGASAPGDGADEGEALAVFTGGGGLTAPLEHALMRKGLPRVLVEPMPLAQG